MISKSTSSSSSSSCIASSLDIASDNTKGDSSLTAASEARRSTSIVYSGLYTN
jgi:hypothetical protein